MNKNGEKTKLLAVIAVFAMVACALVAFAPVADADAAANSYTDVDNGYTISAAGYDNLSFDEKDGKVIVTGYAGYADKSDVIDDGIAPTTYGDLFGTATGSWAYAMITGFDESAEKVTIKQTNSALDVAYPNTYSGVKTTERPTATTAINEGYIFLIPNDGSTVTIELTYTNGDDGWQMEDSSESEIEKIFLEGTSATASGSQDEAAEAPAEDRPKLVVFGAAPWDCTRSSYAEGNVLYRLELLSGPAVEQFVVLPIFSGIFYHVGPEVCQRQN